MRANNMKKKILRKQVQYRRFEDNPKEKLIFLYDKEGKEQSTKIFKDGKLDQSAKYFYNNAKKLAEVQITYHRLNKKEFIFYAYDKFGKLKEAKICFKTPDNLIFRIIYIFESKYSCLGKCFDSQGNLLTEENIFDLKYITVFTGYSYKDLKSLDEYKRLEKIDPENHKILSLKHFKNKTYIKINEYKGTIIKILADKNSNTKKYYRKDPWSTLLVRKYYW